MSTCASWLTKVPATKAQYPKPFNRQREWDTTPGRLTVQSVPAGGALASISFGAGRFALNRGRRAALAGS